MTVQERQYLTASDVTRLLRIDKSTVYRMAEDGRLSGVKVGRQWRFPAEELGRAFGIDVGSEAGTTGSDPHRVEALTSLFADLYGVMAVVTDLHGRPLTRVFNPSDYFNVIDRDPAAVGACIGEWRSHAMDHELQPNLRPSHFGFLCARAYIRSGFELVGTVIAGGVAPREWPPSPTRLEEIAAGTGVASSELEATADSVARLDTQETQAMLAGLSTLARHLSPDQAKE
jgi:excisionase family DNA binding protein